MIFGGTRRRGAAVFPGVGTLRIIFVRTQAHSIGRSAPCVVIQTPSFPSGFPPPRGIGDIPRIMHDKRWCDTRTYRGALTNFNRRALLGEEFGARALCPCLLSVSLALGTQRARRDFQAAAAPPVKVWLSGALFRLRKNVVRGLERSERVFVGSKNASNSHSLIRSNSGPPKSTGGEQREPRTLFGATKSRPEGRL